MHKRSVAFILLCSLLLSMPAQAMTIQEKPDWLHGTLLINTMASTEVLPRSQKPVAQAICAIDFDNELLTTVDVPSNSMLVSNTFDGKPMVVYQKNACYGITEFIYQAQSWRNYGFGFVDVSQDGVSVDTEMENVFISKYPIALVSLSRDPSKDYDLTRDLFAPSRPYTRIYFCYGISEDSNDMRIQLIREIAGWEAARPDIKVLKTFDADCPLGSMSFALTETQCAYSHAGKICSINMDDLQTAICPEERTYGAICWLGDRLIYNVYPYDGWEAGQKPSLLLKIWNPKTGEISSLATLWDGDEIDLATNQMSLSMSINRDSSILAIYFCGDTFDESRVKKGGRIVFVSLENGEVYELYPWDKIAAENGVYPWFFNTYCISDDGKVIYEPAGMIDARVVWYRE